MGCKREKAAVSQRVFKGDGRMRIVLIVATSIYLMVAGLQDLKERQIYSFPCITLSSLWMIAIAMNMRMPSYMYLIYMAVTLMLYFIFTKKKIWGAGDSDLFFLFSVVYVAGINEVISVGYIMAEIILFIGVLVSALMLGWIEARIKKKKLGKESSIAVATGFALVIIAMMWRGVIG